MSTRRKFAPATPIAEYAFECLACGASRTVAAADAQKAIAEHFSEDVCPHVRSNPHFQDTGQPEHARASASGMARRATGEIIILDYRGQPWMILRPPAPVLH